MRYGVSGQTVRRRIILQWENRRMSSFQDLKSEDFLTGYSEQYRMTPRKYKHYKKKRKYLRENRHDHWLELEHFSLDKICDSGQCFRMRKAWRRTFSMVATSIWMYQKGGGGGFLLLSGEFVSVTGALFWSGLRDYEAYIDTALPNHRINIWVPVKAGRIRILRQDLWEMIVTFLISQQEQYQAYPPNVSKPSAGNFERKIHLQV